jgi:hypothetical protein
MDNRREHQRTPFQQRFTLFHPAAGAVIVNTRDFSESGVFLETGPDLVLPIGTEVEGQLMDLAFAAPRVRMQVVRHGDDGMGMRFFEDESDTSDQEPDFGST